MVQQRGRKLRARAAAAPSHARAVCGTVPCLCCLWRVIRRNSGDGVLSVDAARDPLNQSWIEKAGLVEMFAEHSDAHCVVETEMLFLGEGAVTYFAAEGEVDYVFNAMTLKAAQEGAAQIDLCPN